MAGLATKTLIAERRVNAIRLTKEEVKASREHEEAKEDSWSVGLEDLDNATR